MRTWIRLFQKACRAETDGSQPTIPLSAVGRQRAELLSPTLNGVTFTHVFAAHTTRARQMLEDIAGKHDLQIVQLPVPVGRRASER
jgi:broad specificity phosphatase PhoE